MRNLLLTVCLLAVAATLAAAQQYDLVLEGGRVMDPETGLDAVRNVGIRDGKIATYFRWLRSADGIRSTRPGLSLLPVSSICTSTARNSPASA